MLSVNQDTGILPRLVTNQMFGLLAVGGFRQIPKSSNSFDPDFAQSFQYEFNVTRRWEHLILFNASLIPQEKRIVQLKSQQDLEDVCLLADESLFCAMPERVKAFAEVCQDEIVAFDCLSLSGGDCQA